MFLKSNPRYAAARLFNEGMKGNFEQEAKALQQAGYATDPEYANNLIKVFKGPAMQHALKQFDHLQNTLTPDHAIPEHPLHRAYQRMGLSSVPLDIQKLHLKAGAVVQDLDAQGHANVTARLVERCAEENLSLSDIHGVQRFDFHGKDLIVALNEDHSKITTADAGKYQHIAAEQTLQATQQNQEPVQPQQHHCGMTM